MEVDSQISGEDPRAPRVRQACAQMGLTAETRHLRQAPRALSRGDGGRSDEQRRGGGGRRREGQGVGERLQRWLGWALRHGHRELLVTVDSAGWADLNDLAFALRGCRSDFGEVDGARLRALLLETDDAGRFEISGDKLRKVGRDEHRPRVASRAPEMPAALTSARQGARNQRARSISDSSSHRVRRASRSLSSSAPRPVVLGKAEAPAGGKPSKPPGPYWTRFQDGGQDWWFYEGPLGKWWSQEGIDSDIQPYEE